MSQTFSLSFQTAAEAPWRLVMRVRRATRGVVNRMMAAFWLVGWTWVLVELGPVGGGREDGVVLEVFVWGSFIGVEQWNGVGIVMLDFWKWVSIGNMGAASAETLTVTKKDDMVLPISSYHLKRILVLDLALYGDSLVRTRLYASESLVSVHVY
jgi:hypothetical protein